MVEELSCLEKLQTGDSKRVKITLNNDTDQAELIELKKCDYANNCDGQHFFDQVGTQARSNASWINLNTNRIHLGPREKADIYISIEVPNQKTLKGSYWSVLLIEPADLFQTIKDPQNGLTLQIK
ncbi:MAG: hypothetical protein H0X29_11600, partial [Parachlamydiaceae bacterium]|nr:hypothetical protein [Parachlamydiaceae bacterium]